MIVQSLQIVERVQVENFVDPFDHENAGFTTAWWLGFAELASDQARRLFSFMDGENEVARASVDEHARINGNSYEGLSGRAVLCHDVDFFEVAAHRRREGIGREAVTLLRDHYPSALLIAFSEEADGFWSSVGWTLHPRRDRSDMHRPLFISTPRG